MNREGNKQREYVKDFDSEQQAFEYLFQRNKRQSYCYGCVDSFKDNVIHERYISFRGSLSIGEYYKLMAY